MGTEIQKDMKVEKIVCDTGPILHLREIGRSDLLARGGKIFIPEMVDIELREINYSWQKQKPSWIYIETLSSSEMSQAAILYNSGIVDMGEAEAIILAQRLKADWLLTDDIAARVFASSLGLECHGSLGIVLWAAAVGYLEHKEAKDAITKLTRSSLWISQDIIKEAYEAIEKMF